MRYGVEASIGLKMEKRGLRDDFIEAFLRMVRRVRDEPLAHVPLDRVSIPDRALLCEIPHDLPQRLELEHRGRQLLSKVVVIKLNGGRSTTMGGEVPKGVLTAKDGMSYVEIILRQIQCIRQKWQVDVPVVLMNSFFTHAPTMKVVRRSDVPVLTFMQNEVPRLQAATLEPLETGTDEDWAPPGHGDVYSSLKSTGLLERLLNDGRRWAFISNLDNLAAWLDPCIPGMIETEAVEFLLEVTDRTNLDRKGGTLVVRNGRLDLLEIAQVSHDERPAFMDIDRFPVFNTNNVWVNLEALEKALNEDTLQLPIIQNTKRVCGSEVIQLETAMGAAIGCFSRARGLRVGRDRFFPTKKVEDLFVLQSDACALDSMFRLKKSPARPESLAYRPSVLFDRNFLDSPLRMHEVFEDPASISLVGAESLTVAGHVFFGRDVKIVGNVRIESPSDRLFQIPRGTVLTDGDYP